MHEYVQLSPGISILVYILMLAPMVQTLQSVSDELCGGNLKFVWHLDKRNITVLAPTSGDGWNDVAGIQIQAIQEAQRAQSLQSLQGADNTQYGVWLSNVNALLDTSEYSLDTLVDMSNAACGDLATGVPMLNYLREGLENQSLTGCADASMYCNSVSKMPGWELDGGKGYFTRMLCSETCGCSNPGGSYFFVDGCPYGKKRPCYSSTPFQETLQTTSCQEKTPQELRSSTTWLSWVTALRSFADAGHGLQGQAEARLLAQAPGLTFAVLSIFECSVFSGFLQITREKAPEGNVGPWMRLRRKPYCPKYFLGRLL